MDSINKNEENEKMGDEIQKTSRTSFFQRLAMRFGFAVSGGEDTPEKVVLIQKPTPDVLVNRDTKTEMDMLSKILKSHKMSSKVEELYDSWMNDTQNTYRNVYERLERINALTYMCDNEGIVENAVNLVASEVANTIDNNVFSVISENAEWQERTNLLLKNVWKYNKANIYSLAYDIFLYGEGFQSRMLTSAGVTSIENLKPDEVIERLEFKPSQAVRFQVQASASGGYSSGFALNIMNPVSGGFGQNNLSFTNPGSQNTTYMSADALLKDYIENIKDTSMNEFLASHLLGYRVGGDQLLAPWQISHFRLNSENSEFWPYGKPRLLPCLSAWKQFQRAMGLDDLSQLLSLPIYMYKVKTAGATTARAFDIVNDVKEDFENVGLMSESAGVEGPSLCTNIWTSDDLLTVEKVNGDNTGSENVDKLQFFYKRLATATLVPMSYLDPASDGFQMSGVALQTLYKPFRTLIESIRAVIMSEVEDTIRLHDSIRNEETPDFVLIMNVDNGVANDETSSRLQLSDSMMEAIANLLGLEDKAQLPLSVKKDILFKYAGVSRTELESYLNILDNEGASGGEGDGEEGGDDFGGGDFGGGMDDGGMEESINLKKEKTRLIEAKYQSVGKDLIKFYLVENLGALNTEKEFCKFNSGVNSKKNEEYINFLKKRPKMKNGKKQLKD